MNSVIYIIVQFVYQFCYEQKKVMDVLLKTVPQVLKLNCILSSFYVNLSV